MLDWTLFAGYVLLGPLLWAFLAVALRAGRFRMNKLKTAGRRWRRDGGPNLDDPPPVTILVPVKDEAAGIELCVRNLLAQDYPRFALLVADDRSTDGTGAILDDLAAEFSDRLRVTHLTNLPPGWLGKPHALREVVTAAGDDLGDWLWFVDSDVRCEPAALSQMIALCRERQYDFLSLMVGLVAPSFAEKLVTPAATATWAMCFRIADTNDARRDTAAANGQCLLLRRDLLARIGGHAAVRDKTCEDVELARLAKTCGAAVRFLLGQHLAKTRMHATPQQMFNGWARNFAGTARHRPGPLLMALGFVWLAAAAWVALPLAVWLGSLSWSLVAAIHLAIVWAVLVVAYRDAGFRPALAAALALLFPVTAVALSALLLNGVRACLGGTVRWRGDQVRA